jgi:hypothetical protein
MKGQQNMATPNGEYIPLTEQEQQEKQAFHERLAAMTPMERLEEFMPGLAKFLKKHSVTHFEKISQECNEASIGFSETEQKWYGWSHRGVCGFGVGDVVEDGDVAATSGWIDEYLEQHPEADLSLPIGFEAKTIDDAKKIAIAYASAIS